MAGGVNLTLARPYGLAYLRAGMLSPDGRCKTFDASANGYGRGEGVGVVVLKRLADAEQRRRSGACGDPRARRSTRTAPASALRCPTDRRSERLIRAALADAGYQPTDIVYLEAHGTGTSLGDPIEVGAAAAALGVGRGLDRPLLLGSVKANIGHLRRRLGLRV